MTVTLDDMCNAPDPKGWVWGRCRRQVGHDGNHSNRSNNWPRKTVEAVDD